MLQSDSCSPTQKAAKLWLSSLNDWKLAASSPAAMGRAISAGRWRIFRHISLYNRIALALAAGVLSNVIINVQPQTGKSEFWSQMFPTWHLGTFPEQRVVLASYGEGYAAKWGRNCRDLLELYGQKLFNVSVRQDTRAADEWNLLGHRGGMVTAGVGGPLTGQPADLGIIDDPIKDHDEAASQTRKDKVFDWYDAVFSSRFGQAGKKVILMTRWATDDLVGRILERAGQTGEDWKVIRLPAIAEEDENWPELNWKRAKGDVLCPELYNLATMQKREKNTLPFWFATLYQQRPYPREGGEFKSSWFQIVDEVPKLWSTCRSWDLAASEDKRNAQTAGVKMGFRGVAEDREYYVTDVIADHWLSGPRDKEIKQAAQVDGRGVPVLVEQEPGSGGKAQAEAIVRKLDGFTVKIVIAGSEGSKLLRADPLASAAHAGRVFLKRAPWNEKFLEQVRRFPGGKPIDIIDSAAQGYNHLAGIEEIVLPSDYNPEDDIPEAPANEWGDA